MKEEGFSFIDKKAAQRGVKVSLGDAVFRIKMAKNNQDYKEAYFVELSKGSEEVDALTNKSRKAKSSGRHEEHGALQNKLIKAEAHSRRRAISALIVGWKIKEGTGEWCDGLVGYLAAKFPECISGETGSRVAAYSKDAAKFLCEDEGFFIEADTENLTFSEWVDHKASVDAFDGSTTEDFVFLGEDSPA